jgi:hypothetical protein
VARVWQRADAGGLRGHTDFPAAAWDNAPDFEVANTDRNPQRLADSIQVKLATGFDAFEPAPDSVYRSYEGLEHFRFPGLPKGRYWVRIHGLTPGLSDTTKALAISMKLEGKLAYEGHFPLPTKTKTWSAVSFYAKTTVSDTDGLYGELVGFAAAQIYVAGIEVFDVGLPPVTVLAPNGGEKYTVGDTVRIHWNTDGVVNSVGIQVSLDSGKSMIPVTRTESIELGEKAWGDYAWVIPDSLDGKSLVGTGTMISIYDYFGSDRDKSDATFTLEAKAASLQPGAIAALKRPFQARWLSGLGVQLQGLKPGVVDLALMDSQGRYQSFQRHIPVSTQGDARWNTQVNRGLYRLWIRQGTAKRAVPLLVF